MMNRIAMTLACGLALVTAQAARADDAAADQNGAQTLQEQGKAEAPATTDSSKMQATPKGTDTLTEGRGSSDQSVQSDAPATVDSQKMQEMPKGTDTLDEGRGASDQTAAAAPAPEPLKNLAKQDNAPTTGVNSNALNNKASSSASSSRAMLHAPEVSASPFKRNDGYDANGDNMQSGAASSGTGSAAAADASSTQEPLDVATDEGRASSSSGSSNRP